MADRAALAKKIKALNRIVPSEMDADMQWRHNTEYVQLDEVLEALAETRLAADDFCNCGHKRVDHSELEGPCDFIKWIGGHPEYRCMCIKFIRVQERENAKSNDLPGR
jgi:hypothetical protein